MQSNLEDMSLYSRLKLWSVDLYFSDLGSWVKILSD